MSHSYDISMEYDIGDPKTYLYILYKGSAWVLAFAGTHALEWLIKCPCVICFVSHVFISVYTLAEPNTCIPTTYVVPGIYTFCMTRALGRRYSIAIQYLVYCRTMAAPGKDARRRSVNGKRLAVEDVQTDRSTLEPSSLATVKGNYWKTSVGQSLKVPCPDIFRTKI